MKKITHTLTTACMAVLLFSFGMAHAQTVNVDPSDADKAISIDGLIVNIGGTDVTYDVVFSENVEASVEYGDYANPVFDFNSADAEAASEAIIVALQAAGLFKVGAASDLGFGLYYIAFDTFLQGPNDTEYADCWVANNGTSNVEWNVLPATQGAIWNNDLRTWARFTEAPLGIDDETFGAAISVYPNPADNVVHIKTTANITAINISDITGKVIQNLQFKVGASATTLDVSAFTAGVYFLKLEDDKGRVSVKKILIQ